MNKTNMVRVTQDGSFFGEFARPKRLLNGEWSFATAPTPELRGLTRKALQSGHAKITIGRSVFAASVD